jgi:hypothetical protein
MYDWLTEKINHYQFLRPVYQEAHVDAYLSALPKGTYEGLFNPWAAFHCSTSGTDYVSHSQQWTSEAPIFHFRRYVYHLE